jgi:uncharacterized RDD family membrane protein YckC
MSNVPGISCTNHWEVVEGLQNCSRCAMPFCGDCLVTIGGRVYCANCKHEEVRDVVSGVSGLQLASRGRRFAAQFIDGCLYLIPFVAIMWGFFGTSSLSSMSRGVLPEGFRLFSYAGAAIFVMYEALMLAERGQTLGKMAMHVKVVRADGSDISRGQAWGRAIVRALMLSVLAIINYLPAFLTKDRTCVHDMAAKTRVINWN